MLTEALKILIFVSCKVSADLFGGSPLTDTSPPWDHVDHPETIPSDFFAQKSVPYPTNVWWQNMVLNDGQNVAAVLPYLVKAQDTELHVNLPGQVVNPTVVFMVFEDNIIFSATEQIDSRSVTKYDELSATVSWKGSADDAYFEAPLVRGMAYTTVFYEKLTPKITIPNLVTVNGQKSGQVSGRLEIMLNNNQFWILYTSSDITFDIDATEKTLTATDIYKGSLKVAGVWAENGIPTESVEILDECNEATPIGGKIGAEVTGDLAIMTFEWEVVTIGPGPLLMMALPHHLDTMIFKEITPIRTNHKIGVLKGTMEGIKSIINGASEGYSLWNFAEPLSTISWRSPSGIPSEKTEEIKNALQHDIEATSCCAGDPYYGGKEMAVFARLSLIADEIGEPELAQRARDRVKPVIEQWLGGTNENKILYDKSWGGVVSSHGMNDKNADFGNGWYNDHHFHWGYHIYTAAVIADAEPGWVEPWNDRVLHMVSDISDPSRQSSYYPFMRTKDWFDGHSWASGIFEFNDGKNQESTSESVNGYYAVYLYGLTTGNSRLRDIGRLSLALEIRAAWKYWQMTTTESVFPAPFSDNKAVGIQWSTKVDYATWFGGNVEYIHCIQMLPFTPISEELLRREWIDEEYPVLEEAYSRASPPLSEEWKGYIIMAHAIIDPVQAYEEALKLTSFDDGNTKTNTLYWIATREEGEPRTTVTVDPTEKLTTTASTVNPTDHPDGCNCGQETETDYRCLEIPNDPYDGLGCDACGVPDCRFCNFGVYPPCDADFDI